MSDGRVPILYIAPWVDLGGSDKGTIDWFKHIDRERWAPSLITTQPSPNRWLHLVEPFAEELWQLPDLMPGGGFPEFILGFLESRGVRLVHIMNSRLGFDLLPDMACLPEPPAVVVQMHAEEPNQAGYVRYVTRRYGNLVDAFSVTSEHLKETVVGYEIAPSRVEVIHSGVDAEEEFDPERVEPLELGGEAPRILWPGRLVEQKDPMLTLEALARVRARGTEFVLDVVGDGHMKPAVQSRAVELGIADSIEWHPPSQEMPRWYRSADLMLMTSVYEGVPYVIYESLAMGVPVVAPAIPGNREFMDADSGVLVDPRDDAARYADAIVELLGDEDRRAEIGRRSRRRMREEFSLGEMGRRHDELYERLLAARPASSRWRSEELFGSEDGAEHAEADSRATAEPLILSRAELPARTIGVVVPCFRHGIFLDECIGSIKAQTLAAAQIVVVDDGSEDPETIEALARLELDPEVTVLRLPVNSGPSTARNRALEELETSYMLPVDADDKLLPDALERMLARLETAPEDVGFVYPHAQHFGNRSDFVRLPAYNLWLLMQENYCPAPALFDMRLFDHTGIAYPEDVVVGHEDWDLILQLAERGIRGLHADGPTFLYRRQGFSRVNAVDYGPHAFHEAIERRHPALYRERDGIKASWAPAVSIVLLDPDAWGGEVQTLLSRQSCRDFEVVSGDDPQAAIGNARGRWVALLGPAAETELANRCFVELLLHGFAADDGMAAIVLAEAPGPARPTLAQIDDEERLAARPAGVVFERLPLGLSAVELGDGDPLAELAIALQANGAVQWRALGGGGSGAGRAGAAWTLPARPGKLDLDFDRDGDRSEVAMRISVARQAPRLPELSAGAVRRWKPGEPWLPAGCQPLCRHIQIDGEHRLLSNDREPPAGYVLEFELGAVQIHPAPGTRRLVQSGQELELSDDQNDLGKDRHGYGYLEQQPLPLLEHLELRRLPSTGQQVLVAGPDDPLFLQAEPLDSLGWIEARPILPRHGLFHVGPWGVDVLWREAPATGWRHRYGAGEPGSAQRATVLGSLFRQPAGGLVALRLRSDGRLVSDLAKPGRASRNPARLGRWVAGPILSKGDRSGSATREARARLRHLADGRGLSQDEGQFLGWLRAEGATGCSPLFSATHPVTGDQLVTCSAREAEMHGYPLEGVLGYILDAGSDRLA